MAQVPTENAEFLEQVKLQYELDKAEKFFSQMTNTCFKKCINKPGKSLDASEQKCVSLCMDRFMDSWNLISQKCFQRMQGSQ